MRRRIRTVRGALDHSQFDLLIVQGNGQAKLPSQAASVISLLLERRVALLIRRKRSRETNWWNSTLMVTGLGLITGTSVVLVALFDGKSWLAQALRVVTGRDRDLPTDT